MPPKSDIGRGRHLLTSWEGYSTIPGEESGRESGKDTLWIDILKGKGKNKQRTCLNAHKKTEEHQVMSKTLRENFIKKDDSRVERFKEKTGLYNCHRHLTEGTSKPSLPRKWPRQRVSQQAATVATNIQNKTTNPVGQKFAAQQSR